MPDIDIQATDVGQQRPAFSPVPVFSNHSGVNLLQFRAVRALVTWSGFPAVLQVLVLGIFVSLAVLGWGYYTPKDINAKLYAKTNLVNLAIWGLWWPAIIWVTFWLGRAWCIVCPLELISSQAEKLGKTLGVRQAPLGGWLAKGSLVILFFAFLQLLVPGVQLHRVPHYTSLFLWSSLALAFAVGLFFKDRAFCRGFCPVALLLSAYGRGGMLAVRPSVSNACAAKNRAPNARACPSLLNPARLSSNKDCLVCGDCLKADTAGQMQLLLRAPYATADARESMASWPLTLFVIVVSGFVTYELCGVWKAAEPVFGWAPEQAIKAWHAGATAGWIRGLWTVVVVPLVLWLVLGGLGWVLGAGKSLGEVWRRLALPVGVVVAAGHMAKGLEKFTSWAGFLPHALSEPTGVQTALQMSAKTLAQPTPWLTLSTLSMASMLLLAIGVFFAAREARLAEPKGVFARFIPILTLGGFYFFLVFGWGGWLTAARP